MRRALELASRARGRTFPNPLVGAVVLSSDGQVAGEGYHRCCGEPHAETEALRAAGPAARGATLVVTLEPCCHHGRTGPCTDAILEAGITRTVIGARDPNPKVDGAGIERLRSSGVETVEGVLRDEAEELNEAYFHFVRTGRSLVRLKLAVSLDGRVAAEDGSSRWVTGVAARKKAHELRAASSAVLVGAGTALADDPALTVRHGADSVEDFIAPARIVVTGRRKLSVGMRLFSGEVRTVIVRPETAGTPVEGGELPPCVELWSLPGDEEGRVDLEALLKRTAREGLGEILCEGGSGLAASLLRERLVSRITMYLAPMLLGGSGVPAIGGLGVSNIGRAITIHDASVTSLEDGNVLVEGRICSPES